MPEIAKMFSSSYEPGDAIIREFCSLDASLNRTLGSGLLKLSVINYAPLISGIAEANNIYVQAGVTESSIVDTSNLPSNCKIVIDVLVTKGLNGAAACGIAGNIYHESGFNPGAIGDRGTSFGICQWHNSRGVKMKSYVGDTWKTNLSGQVDFLWYELSTSYPAILNYLRGVPNTVEGCKSAADHFVRKFEIPANVDSASIKRQATAAEYFNQLIITSSINSEAVQQQSAVSDSFFSNDAMLGNSLVGGMKIYSGLNTLDYFYENGTTVAKVLNSSMLNSLCNKPRDRIYIELGINEISLDVNTFISQYTTLIDRIKSKRTESNIYITSVLPVTKAKSNQGTFTMARVNNYNTALLNLAKQKNCSYLDVCSSLVDTEGYLPSNYSTDGIHFQPSTYKLWASYMRTHY